jgi:hypothetical protein
VAASKDCGVVVLFKMMKQSVWKSQHENDGLGKYGGRDLVGFGEKTPSPKWPSNAKVALNFVINYEEGGESCILHGDTKSESLLSDIVGAVSYGTLRVCRSFAPRRLKASSDQAFG